MTMMRTRDPVVVDEIIARDSGGDVDTAPWLADDRNVAIEAGDDLALFQWEGGDTYSVHWFFAARGREALTVGADMLSAIFDLYGAQAVWGMTPADKRAARWFNRKLGCTSRGLIDRPDGQVELFIMGREQWESLET